MKGIKIEVSVQPESLDSVNSVVTDMQFQGLGPDGIVAQSHKGVTVEVTPQAEGNSLVIRTVSGAPASDILGSNTHTRLPVLPPHTPARDQLSAIFLDYFNNYATIMTYADQHGLTEGQAGILIALARDVHNSKHPES